MDVEHVFATTSTMITTPDGGRHQVRLGEHWNADDDVVIAAAKQSPGLFTKDPRYGMRYSRPPQWMNEPPVEQATAAPGERRSAVKRG